MSAASEFRVSKCEVRSGDEFPFTKLVLNPKPDRWTQGDRTQFRGIGLTPFQGSLGAFPFPPVSTEKEVGHDQLSEGQ